MSWHSAAAIIKRYALAAGFDVLFAGHSLHGGILTGAAVVGLKTMEVSRHQTVFIC
jgi:hypothetical protein